jgi:sucrose phosphorylase
VDLVEKELDEEGSLRSLVYRGINRLLEFRKAEEAFAPGVAQRVLDTEGAVFALLRGPVTPAGSSEQRRVLCAQNLGGSPVTVRVREAGFPLDRIDLQPWETRWIALGGGGRRELSTAEQ